MFCGMFCFVLVFLTLYVDIQSRTGALTFFPALRHVRRFCDIYFVYFLIMILTCSVSSFYFFYLYVGSSFSILVLFHFLFSFFF